MQWRIHEFDADPAWASQGRRADTSQAIPCSPEEIDEGGVWHVFELAYEARAVAPVVPIAPNPLVPGPPLAAPVPELRTVWVRNENPEVLRISVIPIRVSHNCTLAFLTGMQWAMEMLAQRMPMDELPERGILVLGYDDSEPPELGPEATTRVWLGMAIR